MVKKEYDAIIIGAGNQGLSLAAYLQRSGMEVGIFERRNEEGGCIFSSECTAPGFIHNLHAQYMEFIDWMPFYQDFGLEELGGRMMYPEAQSGIAFSDGRPPIVLYSVEKEEYFKRTHKSIALYSEHMGALIRWEFHRYGLVRVCLFNRYALMRIVQVAVAGRRHHHVMAHLRRFHSTLNTAP